MISLPFPKHGHLGTMKLQEVMAHFIYRNSQYSFTAAYPTDNYPPDTHKPALSTIFQHKPAYKKFKERKIF